jgi:hypothetical protein
MVENFCSRALPTCSREREKWRGSNWPAARVGRERGCAPALPYIGGWAASLAPPPSPRAGGQRGGVGGKFPPFLLEESLRVSPRLVGWALGAWCAWPKWLGHCPLGPCRPPSSGPTMAPLRNLLEHSGIIPINSETFSESKKCFPLYESYSSDHSGTSHDVRDLIRDSEQKLNNQLSILS